MYKLRRTETLVIGVVGNVELHEGRVKYTESAR